MIANIILGNNIDTKLWIDDLKEVNTDHIIVIDYDCNTVYKEENNIVYISPNYAREYVKKFDKLNFYKSLYAYPGMSGGMSSLYKKD